jgi:hypothetical protein
MTSANIVTATLTHFHGAETTRLADTQPVAGPSACSRRRSMASSWADW